MAVGKSDHCIVPKKRGNARGGQAVTYHCSIKGHINYTQG